MLFRLLLFLDHNLFCRRRAHTFPGQFLDTLTEVSSHELAEAVTDPDLNAWWDSSTGDEIGDICNRQTTRLGGFLVQTEWSNAANACI